MYLKLHEVKLKIKCLTTDESYFGNNLGSDPPIIFFHGRFRFLIFFSLSNKQERMKVYINKMFIWYLTGQTGFWLLKTITVTS